MARTRDGSGAEGVASVVGCAASMVVACDRAHLFLAVVVRARAANLARATWPLVCAAAHFGATASRVFSATATADVGRWHLGDRRCLGIQRGSWAGLLTALIGLVGSGGIVWAVRLIGAAALRKEAMGFGDVTLMMMIGTFLGWQACIIIFFLSPFAALLVGATQFALRRDDVIPYGPFLCLATAFVVVDWGSIWMWAQPIFDAGPLVPIVLTVCLVLLGVMLAIWQMIKNALFGVES